MKKNIGLRLVPKERPILDQKKDEKIMNRSETGHRKNPNHFDIGLKKIESESLYTYNFCVNYIFF